MKTPELIKKGLECCHVGDCECERCPYQKTNSCMHWLKQDALEYILLLETGIDQIEKKTKMVVDDAKKAFDELVSRLAQTERERDAAVHDLALDVKCSSCVYNDVPSGKDPCGSCYAKRVGKNYYQWRGVCAENTEEKADED